MYCRGMTAIIRAFRLWSLAFLVPLALVCRSSGEELDLMEALARLQSLKSVDGSAVGAGGTPGGFYLLSKPILEKGNQALFASR